MKLKKATRNLLLVIFSFSCLFVSCKKENLSNINTKEELQVLKKFCFIQNLYNKGKNYISIDFIDYIKKSELNPTTNPQIIELPDNYYYVNYDKKFEDYEISDSVKIVMQKYSYDEEGNYQFGQSIKLSDLLKAVEKPKEARFLFSPFEIGISNNKVISLKEIYIP